MCIRDSRNTTLDDENYDVRYGDWGRPIGKNMNDSTLHADVMTALCNEPEASATDLGDDQSRELFQKNTKQNCAFCKLQNSRKYCQSNGPPVVLYI